MRLRGQSNSLANPALLILISCIFWVTTLPLNKFNHEPDPSMFNGFNDLTLAFSCGHATLGLNIPREDPKEFNTGPLFTERHPLASRARNCMKDKTRSRRHSTAASGFNPSEGGNGRNGR